MGQGAEDTGFYESEYNQYDYEESQGYTVWTGIEGRGYKVSDMSARHLKNAIRMVKRWRDLASFSCEKDLWGDWISVFNEQLYAIESRKSEAALNPRKNKNLNPVATYKETPKAQRGAKVELVCWCGKQYVARKADLKRGWARSCCKSHAAIKRDFGRAEPKTTNGESYKKLLIGESQ